MKKDRIHEILTALVIMACALFFLTRCTSSQRQTEETTKSGAGTEKRILLIGASIGKAWRLAEYPQRVSDRRHVFESIAAYQFDKSEALEEVLMRPKRKFRPTRTYLKGFFEPALRVPDTIIIKECASYFPGSQPAYEESIKAWVKRIKDARVGVVLATVVPVTRERAAKQKGQIEAIWAFNDWVRDYATKEHIVLLDLEAVLRKNGSDRYLNEQFTSGDGQHLNKQAYDILDAYLQAALHREAL
jgi:hypothetical protein